jgi:Cys-rich repeat protein
VCGASSACPAGQSCLSGVCQSSTVCSASSACPAGQVCLGGVCQTQSP